MNNENYEKMKASYYEYRSNNILLTQKLKDKEKTIRKLRKEIAELKKPKPTNLQYSLRDFVPFS